MQGSGVAPGWATHPFLPSPCPDLAGMSQFFGCASQVDVDQCPDISGASSIAAMPTFILYARGREMSRVTGADPAKLRQLLQQATYGCDFFLMMMTFCELQCLHACVCVCVRLSFCRF